MRGQIKNLITRLKLGGSLFATILMAASLAALASAASAQTIDTDAGDYKPGNRVTVTGSGWQPGETLNLTVTNTGTDPEVDSSVVADSDGNFSSQAYVVPDDSTPDIVYTVTASDDSNSASVTFIDGNGPGALCANVLGYGAALCPNASVSAKYNPDHYAQVVGTTATYQILNATDAYTEKTTNADGFNCSAGQVEVQVKSTPNGNHVVCGDLSGSTITFQWAAPADYCETGPVAYKGQTCTTTTQTHCSGHPQVCTTTQTTTCTKPDFGNSDSDIIDNGTIDGSQTSPGSIAYVWSLNDKAAIVCGSAPPTLSVATTIYDASTNTTPPTGAYAETIYDVATITSCSDSVPNGTVSFNFYTDGSCGTSGGSVIPAGSGIALSGSPLSATSLQTTSLTQGNYSFQATYNPGPGDPYAQTSGACEPLTINPPPVICSISKAVTSQLNGSANGVDADGQPVPLSFNFGTAIQDDANFQETLSCTSGSETIPVAGTLAISFFSNGTCTGSGSPVGSAAVSGQLSAPPTQTLSKDALSSVQACLDVGSYSFQAVFTDASDGSTTVGACEPFNITPINPNISTTILLDPVENPVTSVTMGAKVHDTVAVTDPSGCKVPAGSATFTFFPNNSCSNTAASVPPAQNPNPDVETLLNGAAGTGMTSPLKVGAYSYSASYSGDGLDFNAVSASCEPLKVNSSISDFHYNITNTSSYGNPSGPWYCRTLESSTYPTGSGLDPATCPSSEGKVKVSTKTSPQTNSFLITATVTNNTGGSILEKVQGGLPGNSTCYADSNGNCYALTTCSPSNSKCYKINPADITGGSCGSAVISVSNNSNVVLWGNGTTATNQTGFSMSQGQVCTLKVMVKKGFSSAGTNEVTSSWSESQTGPGTWSGQSPYTGSLETNAQP